MPTVTEALHIVLSTKIDIPEEKVALSKAAGRCLQEYIIADRPFPPFNRVAMDGIAVNFSSLQEGKKSFIIEGAIHAGAPQGVLQDTSNCMEVMTGAVLPENTDTVIRYEDIEIHEEKNIKVATLQDISPTQWQNIHLEASDRKKGVVLVNPGTIISPAEAAVAASVGKANLKVSGLPKIAIISTGNELVEIDEVPLPYQIRKSNVYSLQAALAQMNMNADSFHLKDDKEGIYNAISNILQNYHALILSGGVSMGKADFIPEVLQQLQVEQLFHKVSQRPGKPFWFGKKGGQNIVFAFPGNPVSTFLCFYKYFMPWINMMMAAKTTPILFGTLEEDIEFAPSLTYFLQVKITVSPSGHIYCRPIKGKGSGDFANLLESDGFLELPMEKNFFKAGDSYPLIIYRNIF